MNMNDYNDLMENVKIDPKLKDRIFNRYEEKVCRRGFSKRKLIPILAVAVVGCTCITAAFADDFVGIFKKDTNFEMNISKIEKSDSAPETQSDTEVLSEKMPIYNAEFKMWDENVIAELFANDKERIDGYERQSDTCPGYEWKYREYDDNTSIAYEPGFISFSRYSDAYYSYPLGDIIYYKSYGLADIELTDKELNGVDKKKAIEQADNIINKLGISVSSEKTIYSLDKELLIKTDLSRDENGNRTYKHGEILPEWTEEQEAYLIIYNVEFDGMPLGTEYLRHGKWYQTTEWGTEGSLITAVVDKYGIVDFSASRIYDYLGTDKSVNICTAQQAADIISEKFDKDIPNYPTLIDNCRLIYHAAKKGDEYEMRPYWEFKSTVFAQHYTHYPEKETHEYYETYYIDAETIELFSEKGN